MIAPSLVNHWCQASRPSPSTSTSPTAMSWDVRRLAAQTQAECLADGAAATIAADQVSRLYLSLTDRGGYAVGVLAEAAQLGAQFDGHAEVSQPLAHDLLHPPLRDHQTGRVWDVRRGHLSCLGVDLGDHLRSPVLEPVALPTMVRRFAQQLPG